MAENASKIKVGPGLAADTQMGPLVSAEQLARVTGYMDEVFAVARMPRLAVVVKL